MTLTPEQAFNIIIQAAALAPMPKSEHVKVEQAIKVLSEKLKGEQDGSK